MLCCEECDDYIKNGNPGFMDYYGMVTDLNRMRGKFYEYRNTKWLAFMLNFEETEFLNELITFIEYCKEMEASAL